MNSEQCTSLHCRVFPTAHAISSNYKMFWKKLRMIVLTHLPYTHRKKTNFIFISLIISSWLSAICKLWIKDWKFLLEWVWKILTRKEAFLKNAIKSQQNDMHGVPGKWQACTGNGILANHSLLRNPVLITHTVVMLMTWHEFLSCNLFPPPGLSVGWQVFWNKLSPLPISPSTSLLLGSNWLSAQRIRAETRPKAKE
jgi:ABC-type uncharacterized transport system fused permease/ATPase subunit